MITLFRRVDINSTPNVSIHNHVNKNWNTDIPHEQKCGKFFAETNKQMGYIN